MGKRKTKLINPMRSGTRPGTRDRWGHDIPNQLYIKAVLRDTPTGQLRLNHLTGANAFSWDIRFVTVKPRARAWNTQVGLRWHLGVTKPKYILRKKE